MIKGAQENPYKCMNVMKQDAMDNKIIEICKTCEKKKSNPFYISKTS